MVLKIYILQGSAATQLRCGGMLNHRVMANFPQCASERIIIIGQYLWKIWTKVWWHVFLWTTVY